VKNNEHLWCDYIFQVAADKKPALPRAGFLYEILLSKISVCGPLKSPSAVRREYDFFMQGEIIFDLPREKIIYKVLP